MKKYILIASAVFVLLFGGIQLFLFLKRPATKDELSVKAARLPELKLITLDGQPYQPRTDRSLLLIYFNSECDHCQRQIETLKKRADLFKSCSLVLMSAEPVETVAAFRDRAGLDQVANLDLVHVEHEVIAEAFGVLNLPQIFVYNSRGELIDLFSGETNPEHLARLVGQ